MKVISTMTTSTEVAPDNSTIPSKNVAPETQVASTATDTDQPAGGDHAARTMPVSAIINSTDDDDKQPATEGEEKKKQNEQSEQNEKNEQIEQTEATETTEAAEAAEATEAAEAAEATEATEATETEQKEKEAKEIAEVAEEAEGEMVSASHGEIDGYDAVAVVREDLGEEIAKLYSEGRALAKAGRKDGDSLQNATQKYVSALEAAGTGKETTAGYGELSLSYGQALLSFVVRGAAAGGVLGGDVESAVQRGKASTAGASDRAEGDNDEEELGEEKDADEDESLTWTNLEVARVALAKAAEKDKKKFGVRLAAAHATLGEFLLACDQASDAATEFKQAAELHDNARPKAEALYKRYLALRREEPAEALIALRESVKAFESVEDGKDVLKDLMDEEKSFASAVGDKIAEVEKEKEKETQIEVKVVTVKPKRKRENTNNEKNEEDNEKKARTE